MPRTIHGKTLVEYMVIDRIDGCMLGYTNVSTQTDNVALEATESAPRADLDQKLLNSTSVPIADTSNKEPPQQSIMNDLNTVDSTSLAETTVAASGTVNLEDNKKDDFFADLNDIDLVESNSNRATPNKRRPILIGKNVEKLPQ